MPFRRSDEAPRSRGSRANRGMASFGELRCERPKQVLRRSPFDPL